ncbi:hypothetical protein BA723_01105 [Helicobacter sp. CLO-3]|nr:hypothetical protein BA723_01105 [Helicobacter sp. CLO-3]
MQERGGCKSAKAEGYESARLKTRRHQNAQHKYKPESSPRTLRARAGKSAKLCARHNLSF